MSGSQILDDRLLSSHVADNLEMMFSVSYDAEQLCKTLVSMLQSSSDLHLVARSVILRGWHVTLPARIWKRFRGHHTALGP